MMQLDYCPPEHVQLVFPIGQSLQIPALHPGETLGWCLLRRHPLLFRHLCLLYKSPTINVQRLFLG